MREWRRLPVGMLQTILEYRNYARAKAAYERDPKTAHQSPMSRLVQTIEFELAQEEINSHE